MGRSALTLGCLSALLGFAACRVLTVNNQGSADVGLECSLPVTQLFDGGPGRDGIPALTNPALARVADPAVSYLADNDRVIGLVIGSEALAVPLNILWWHEIVNLDHAGRRLAITHCPLTGSSLVFDRANIDNVTFGVSGLLYLSNLVMYDRSEPVSLWPQMLRGARCGRKDGTALTMVASIEMTWAGWRSLYPDTRVVSSATGHARDYRDYPYGDYGNLDDETLIFPLPDVDHRRPLKERVLGVPYGERGPTHPRPRAGMALPFGLLDRLGPLAAVTVNVTGSPTVVFWDRSRQAAMAYETRANGQALTFGHSAEEIFDEQTGSRWRVDGLAVSGPLAGTRLTAKPDAFVAYWFAWAAFYPDAVLWMIP
ncbi:MAG: DUF3179 domain-containing protein [Gemmatimonadetes bacterium]|nr:DUF3179 domain-containing protein [Gemmatimonadota bacterium]